MNSSRLTQLLTFSLAAMQTGSQIAAAAATDIQQDAHHPDLRAALQRGTAMAQQWAARIDQALAEVGGTAAPVNHVMSAHYEVDQRIRQFTATDVAVRDASIIGSAQRVLHYWIAFFGSVRDYAAQAGLYRVEQAMQTSLEEAQQADAQYTQLARKLLRAE